MENRRRGTKESLNNKKPIKNIVMILTIIIILTIYFNFRQIFSMFTSINTLIFIITIPLLIALIYLIVDFLRAKRKLYLGTFILIIIYFMGAIPLFLINNPAVIVSQSEPINIALCGTDTREGEGDISSASRCDSASIISINAYDNAINMVSIPRDAYVLDTCTQNYDKLTHTSLEGMDCYVNTLENLLGVDIDAYIKVNFISVITAIDAVGGIDVAVDQSFYGQDEYDNDDVYYFEGGTTMHLNGSQALSYARERKSFADGDYTRAYHQQQVITGLVQAMMSSGIDGLMDFIELMMDSVDTDLNSGTILKAGMYLLTLDDISRTSYVIQGTSSIADIPSRDLYGLSIQILDEESINEASAMLSIF